MQTILGDMWSVHNGLTANGFNTVAMSVNVHLIALDANGNEIMRSNPHVVCLHPTDDPNAILLKVNADITTRPGMLWPAINPMDWSNFVAHSQIEFTPAVVSNYTALVAAQQAASLALQPQNPVVATPS